MNNAVHQLVQLILQGITWVLKTAEALWIWSWTQNHLGVLDVMGQIAGLEACGWPDRDRGMTGGHIGRRRAARLGCIRAHRGGVLDHGR